MSEQELYNCFTTQEKIKAIKFIHRKLNESIIDRGLCYWSKVAFYYCHTGRATKMNLPTKNHYFPFFHLWFKDAPFTCKEHHWLQSDRLSRMQYCNQELKKLNHATNTNE